MAKTNVGKIPQTGPSEIAKQLVRETFLWAIVSNRDALPDYKAAGVLPLRYNAQKSNRLEALLAWESITGSRRCKYHGMHHGCRQGETCEYLHINGDTQTANETTMVRLNFLGGNALQKMLVIRLLQHRVNLMKKPMAWCCPRMHSPLHETKRERLSVFMGVMISTLVNCKSLQLVRVMH